MSRTQGIAALVAAGLLLLSVLLQSWWSQSGMGASASIGLTRVSLSVAGQEMSMALDTGPGQQEGAWVTAGLVTYWVGLGAAAALALLGLGAVSGVAPGLAVGRLATGLCAAGLLGAVLFFLVLKPEGLDGGTSWGFFAFLLGAVFGIVPKR